MPKTTVSKTPTTADKSAQRRENIRTIYLYLFALVGLTLITIGSVRFVDMGLKAFIFKKADEEQRLYNMMPPGPYPYEKFTPDRVDEIADSADLTSEEKAQIRSWIRDYEDWKQRRSKIDPVQSQRHRDASNSLAMMLIGLPLYAYHWGVIKKETKRT